MIPVIPITYRWLNKDQELGQSIHISEDLLLAGTVCSLLDKVFWSGSLDYLFFLNLWIIDLKDIYLFGAVVLVFYCGIKYEIDQHKS